MQAEDPSPGRRPDLLLEGPLTPFQVGVVCRRAELMLTGARGQELICDVSGHPDLSVIDVLARLALLTQRFQARLQIRASGDAAADLANLVALTGLELLNRPLEARRQAETSE
jgi:hypothetical protein